MFPCTAIWLLSVLPIQPPRDRPPPPGGFELTFQWTERSGPVAFTKEVHVYGNGQVRWVIRSGLGPAREATPPRNRKLAARVRSALASGLTIPGRVCGAPRPGVLLVRSLGSKPRRIPLYDPESWHRYGALAETLVSGALRARPPELDPGCRPLVQGLEPGYVPPKLRWLSAPDETSKLLDRYARADGEDARLEALAKLAWTRGGEPFFRFELLRLFPTRKPATALLELGLASLVRSARLQDVPVLLRRLGHRRGPEASFGAALLLAAQGRMSESAGRLEQFWRLVLPDATLKGFTRRLSAVRKAEATLASGAKTWAAAKRAHARLFLYLWSLLRWSGLWPLPDDDLAAYRVPAVLAYRALHHARLAYFWRGPTIRRGSKQARGFLLPAYAALVKRDWSGLLPVWKMDLVYLTGYLRKNPGLYRGTSFAGPIPVRESVVRLIEMRRFEMARRFLDRKAPPGTPGRGPLLMAAGLAFREMEAWDHAAWAFQQAAHEGSVEAALQAVFLAADRGKVTLARALLDSMGPVLGPGPAQAARALLSWTERGELRLSPKTLRAIERSTETDLRLLAARSLARRGDLARAASLLEADCRPRTPGGVRAFFLLGELALASRRRDVLDRVGKALDAPGSLVPGCGAALQAARAKARGDRNLAHLLARLAAFRAGRTPRALLCVARILTRHRLARRLAAELAHRALETRPGWSLPHALLARLYLEAGEPARAYRHAVAASHRRPEYPPFQRLVATARRRLGTHPGGVP